MATPALSHRSPKPSQWELITLFAFGACALGVLLMITRFDPTPTGTNWYVYLTVLALAAGSIAALLPGAMKFEVRGSIKAGGALAVFALIFYFGTSRAVPRPSAFPLTSYLTFGSSGPSSPFDSDVYVYVNQKLVKAEVRAGGPQLAIADPMRAQTIDINRSNEGGFRIDFKRVSPGDRVWFVVQGDQHYWRSDDIVIPEEQLKMNPVPSTVAFAEFPR